jgi:hypothetical protein
VVQVDEVGVSTARHLTATAVSSEHGASRGGWYVLGRANGRSVVLRAHVGAHVLRITMDHRRCRLRQLDGLSRRHLPGTLTVLADVDRHLVTGTSLVGGPAEHATSKQEEQGVIVEVLPCFTS